MPLTPSFTATQTVDGNTFIITDTSTGSDGAIAGRRVYLQEADGSYLTYSSPPDYIEWPLADGLTLTLTDILAVSTALSIEVRWISSGGVTLYSSTQSKCLDELNETFMYGLVQNIAANRGVMQDINFMLNCFQLAMFTEYAEQAVTTGDDIASSQQLLDFAQVMINDEENFFGFSNSN